MEENPLTHSKVFTDQTLPEVFHGAPGGLWQFLDRDGTKFLNFYWDAAAEKIPIHRRERPFGLNYVFSEPFPRTYVALITLPEPKVAGEAYYSALVYRPDRRILLVTDFTRYFTLEKAGDDDGQAATRLVQWTTHLERVEFPDEIPPRTGPFLDAVMLHLDD
ncbi:MAG TPA: hypothetical protein VN364_03000 [Bellilinea sp.]|nr:hypothetical protein [Bellilinea sp.]